MMMRSLAIAMLLTVLWGCGAMPTQPDQVGTLGDGAVCIRYGNAIRAKDDAQIAMFRTEANRRKLLIAADDPDTIAKENLRIGMSQCAMYASWGAATRENSTVTAAGVSIQHVFGSYRYTRNLYAYTRNGIVTSIQQ